MRAIVICVLILTTQQITAQDRHKGFVYIGPAAYQPVKAGNLMYGGGIGFGKYAGIGSLGIGIEFLAEKKNINIPLYADVRIHFKKAASGPFALFQPGYVIANNTLSSYNSPTGIVYTKQKGGLYLAGGVGFISLIKKIGISCQLKYALIANKITTSVGTTTKTSDSNNPGFVGLSFGLTF